MSRNVRMFIIGIGILLITGLVFLNFLCNIDFLLGIFDTVFAILLFIVIYLQLEVMSKQTEMLKKQTKYIDKPLEFLHLIKVLEI